MNSQLFPISVALLLASALAAPALDNQFAYQGRLTDNNRPTTGSWRYEEAASEIRSCAQRRGSCRWAQIAGRSAPR